MLLGSHGVYNIILLPDLSQIVVLHFNFSTSNQLAKKEIGDI